MTNILDTKNEMLAKVNFPAGFPLSAFKAVETAADACGWAVGAKNDPGNGEFTVIFWFRCSEEDFSFRCWPKTLAELVASVRQTYEAYDPDSEYAESEDEAEGDLDRMNALYEDKERIENGLEELTLALDQL